MSPSPAPTPFQLAHALRHGGPAVAVYDADLYGMFELWRPRDRPRMSQWAEEKFRLSPEYAAKSHSELKLLPWQHEIFDAFSDPEIMEIVLMCSTQMVKTLFLQVAIAYTVCVDPGPILFIGYKDGDVKTFAKDRVAPMMRDVPDLNSKMKSQKSRDPDNAILHKIFEGGAVLTLVGSLSAANLGARTIRIMLADEVDQYPMSIDKQGHAIDIAYRRVAQFESRRKVALASSPTFKNRSRIAAAFKETDQRKPFVTCHHCGHEQILVWQQVKYDSSLSIKQAAASAQYKCANCDLFWTERDRRRNIRNTVRWVKQNPEAKGKAGFWISHLYSQLSMHSMAAMVEEWINCRHDIERRKVFVNTDLAELWEDEGEQPDWEKIKGRAGDLPIGPLGPLPDWVAFLTMGVDVQARRLELQVLGFGMQSDLAVHTVVVDYIIIELFESDGTPKMTTHEDYLKELAKMWERSYLHACGKLLPILATMIDIGFNAEPIYKFAKARPRPTRTESGIVIDHPRTVVCVRGNDRETMSAIDKVSEREAARHRSGEGRDVPIVTLGTGFLKKELYGNLLGRRSAAENRIHIPRDLTDEYFKGLTAERWVQDKNGKASWEKVYDRNEPLDTWNYARAGYYLLRAEHMGPAGWARTRRKFGLPQISGVEEKRQTPTESRIRSSSYLAD